MLDAIPIIIMFAAASGFLFTDKCLRYRYEFPREQGQRLYLRAILFGLPFLVAAYAIYQSSLWLSQLLNLPALFSLHAQQATFIVCASNLVLAWLSAVLYNRRLGKTGEFDALNKAMSKNDYDAILWRGLQQNVPVLISLESRKVYVGLITRTLDTRETSHLTLLPIFSGHRDPDTLQFQISVTYEPVLKCMKDVDLSDRHQFEALVGFCKAFPRNRIVSMHLFNKHMYDSVNSQYLGGSAVGQASNPPPTTIPTP